MVDNYGIIRLYNIKYRYCYILLHELALRVIETYVPHNLRTNPVIFEELQQREKCFAGAWCLSLSSF